MSFALELAVNDGCAAVAGFGEIDVRTAPELRAELTRVLDDGAHRVVVDLAGVTFCDSSGLGVLAGAHRRLARAGGRLEVVGAAGLVAKTLELTGLADVFELRNEADLP